MPVVLIPIYILSPYIFLKSYLDNFLLFSLLCPSTSSFCISLLSQTLSSYLTLILGLLPALILPCVLFCLPLQHATHFSTLCRYLSCRFTFYCLFCWGILHTHCLLHFGTVLMHGYLAFAHLLHALHCHRFAVPAILFTFLLHIYFLQFYLYSYFLFLSFHFILHIK